MQMYAVMIEHQPEPAHWSTTSAVTGTEQRGPAKSIIITVHTYTSNTSRDPKGGTQPLLADTVCHSPHQEVHHTMSAVSRGSAPSIEEVWVNVRV